MNMAVAYSKDQRKHMQMIGNIVARGPIHNLWRRCMRRLGVFGDHGKSVQTAGDLQQGPGTELQLSALLKVAICANKCPPACTVSVCAQLPHGRWCGVELATIRMEVVRASSSAIPRTIQPGCSASILVCSEYLWQADDDWETFGCACDVARVFWSPKDCE